MNHPKLPKFHLYYKQNPDLSNILDTSYFSKFPIKKLLTIQQFQKKKNIIIKHSPAPESKFLSVLSLSKICHVRRCKFCNVSSNLLRLAAFSSNNPIIISNFLFISLLSSKNSALTSQISFFVINLLSFSVDVFITRKCSL